MEDDGAPGIVGPPRVKGRRPEGERKREWYSTLYREISIMRICNFNASPSPGNLPEHSHPRTSGADPKPRAPLILGLFFSVSVYSWPFYLSIVSAERYNASGNPLTRNNPIHPVPTYLYARYDPRAHIPDSLCFSFLPYLPIAAPAGSPFTLVPSAFTAFGGDRVPRFSAPPASSARRNSIRLFFSG